MWQECRSTRVPRPFARAWKRFWNEPRSTWIVFTFSASMSAPSLCSALAIADSSSFLISAAPAFGEKVRMLIAWSTFLPRTRSATRRPFCAERWAPRKDALVSISAPYFFAGAAGAAAAGAGRRGLGRRRRFRGALAGCRVALENARQRELAELVPDHVFGDVHGNV